MSAITWKGNYLFQHVGNYTEELGLISFDNNSETFVLWLKDTCDAFGSNRGYTRGDEYPSLNAAKMNAAASKSAFIFHLMWLREIATVKQKSWRAIIDRLKRRVVEFLCNNWKWIISELVRPFLGYMEVDQGTRARKNAAWPTSRKKSGEFRIDSAS